MAGRGDIGKAMAYQIKREVAQRYFGYRKIIEEDKQALEKMVEDFKNRFDELKARELARIHLLLKDPELIKEFHSLLGWDMKDLDMAPQLSERERKQLLEDLEPHGLTAKARYINMVVDAYKELHRRWEELHDLYEEILDEAEVVNEEIKRFKSKFSLDEILSFFRTLEKDEVLSSSLGEQAPQGHTQKLAEQMSFETIDVHELLPFFPSLPDLEKIRKKLKKIAARAYQLRGN